MFKNSILSCFVFILLSLFLSSCTTTPDSTLRSVSAPLVFRESGKGKAYYIVYQKVGSAETSPKELYEKPPNESFNLVVSSEKKFSQIAPYSDKRAVVEIFRDGKAQLADYDLGSEKLSPLPTSKMMYKDGYLFSYNPPVSQTDPFDLYFHSPFTPRPLILKKIGGGKLYEMANRARLDLTNLRQPDFLDSCVVVYKNFIVIYSLGEGGKPVSQVLDLKGSPITPQIGYIYRSHYQNEEQALSEVGPMPGEYFQKEKLYLPLNQNGQLIPLPGDAQGVTFATNKRGYVQAWFVMFPDEKGLMGVLHQESLTKIPATIANGARLTDFAVPVVNSGKSSLEITNLAIRNSKGQWYFTPSSSSYVHNAGIGSHNLQSREDVIEHMKKFDAMTEGFRASERAAQQKIIDAKNQIIEAERAKKRALLTRELEALPNICDRFRDALEAGPTMGERFLNQCHVRYESWFAIAAQYGVNESVISDARTKWKNRVAAEESARARAEEERKQRQYSRGGGLLEHLQKTTGSSSPATGSSAPSQQQQRYQWERDLNRQLYKKDYDPYK